MAIFNGTYRWEGKKISGRDPIAWSPGAYEVKIYRRSSDSDKIAHMKPFVCVYSKTGEGQSISANPEKFAKQLCEEFSLEIERVLWVEDLQTNDQRYDVITFSRSAKVGDITFYNIEKREATVQEISLLQQELQTIAA